MNSMLRIVVAFPKCLTQDRKATRVGRLYQIWLLWIGLSLVPYSEYPIRNSHVLLGIVCYSEPYFGQTPHLGCCSSLLQQY